MADMARFKETSKRELERLNLKLRGKLKEHAQLGGLGNEMFSQGTNMLTRHLFTGLLGPAAAATGTQKVILLVLSVGSLGLRVGLGRGKAREGIALLAGATTGFFAAVAERLIQAFAGIQEAG